MQRNLLVTLFLGLILIGCHPRKTAWNSDVPSNIKNEIKSLNDSVLDAISSGHSQKLKQFFSDKLKEQTGNDLDSVVSQMHALIKTKNYAVLDECFITSKATGTKDTITNGDKGSKAYKINFDVETNEMYVSLLLHESEDGQLLVTCIYGKYGDGWKLNVFRVGRYSYFGNTAIDIYNQAKSKYEQGDVTDAANIIVLAKQPLSPAYQFFQFDMEKEIKVFARKVVAEADTSFRFPNMIGELKTEPIIYNIRPLPMQEGIFPVITYGTKVNFHDTLALKNENDGLQKIIGQLFPGIEKNNKYIFFQAYQQTSAGLKPGSHLEFVMHGTVTQP